MIVFYLHTLTDSSRSASERRLLTELRTVTPTEPKKSLGYINAVPDLPLAPEL